MATTRASFVNSPSCSWAPNTTAARLRAATTASCGAPPPPTSTKMANMASVLTSVSVAAESLQNRSSPPCASQALLPPLFWLHSADLGWRESRLTGTPGKSCSLFVVEYGAGLSSKELAHFGALRFCPTSCISVCGSCWRHRHHHCNVMACTL